MKKVFFSKNSFVVKKVYIWKKFLGENFFLVKHVRKEFKKKNGGKKTFGDIFFGEIFFFGKIFIFGDFFLVNNFFGATTVTTVTSVTYVGRFLVSFSSHLIL